MTRARSSGFHRALEKKRQTLPKCSDSCASTVNMTRLIEFIQTVMSRPVISAVKCRRLGAVKQSRNRSLSISKG